MNLQQIFHFADSKHRRGKLVLSIVLPALLLLAVVVRQIANGDVIGWSHGFNHPLEGWDHLVTMLAVGIWAAQMRGHSIWLLPLSFVGVMSIGGFVGALGLSIPSVEGIILLSTAVFSILVTRKIRFSSKMNVLIVAFFAFFHGFAHGQEISTSASLLSYTVGFMLATLLLHGAGILLAKIVLLSIACLMSMIFSLEIQANNPLSQNSHFLSTFADSDLIEGNFGVNHSISPYNSSSDVLKSSMHRHQSALSPGFIQATQNDKCTQLSFGINAAKSFGDLISRCNKNQQLHLFSDFLSFELSFIFFNDYYPDINHSPGTDLRSSGVGLNSPPVATANLARSLLVSLSAVLFFLTLEVQSLLITNSKAPIIPVANLTKMFRRLSCACHFYYSQYFTSSNFVSSRIYDFSSGCVLPSSNFNSAQPTFLSRDTRVL